MTDPLEAFTPFKAYKRRGVEATISCMTGSQAQRAVTDWAFTLCKANMQVRHHCDLNNCSLGMRACARSTWQLSTYLAAVHLSVRGGSAASASFSATLVRLLAGVL
jgi:hypothetical protein